jgi:hypothetical protein
MQRLILGGPVLLAVLMLTGGLAEAITIDTPFNFRDNRGPNIVGGITGDINIFGALNVVPSGAGTSATAMQGSTTLDLPFVPLTPMPNQYLAAIPFNPSLTGAWTITATDSSGSVSGADKPHSESPIDPARLESSNRGGGNDADHHMGRAGSNGAKCRAFSGFYLGSRSSSRRLEGYHLHIAGSCLGRRDVHDPGGAACGRRTLQL